MNYRCLLPFLILFGGNAIAQTQNTDDPNAGPQGSGGWTYIGDQARIGIGIDDDGDLLGDGLFIFAEDEDSAWLGEGWIADGGAGGVKLNYHWLSGAIDPENPDQLPEGAFVHKLFVAVDQNLESDRKATFGWGMERQVWFMNVQGSAAISGSRLVNEDVDINTITETGFIDGRPFEQDFTTTTITRLFEHPYDYGVGARVGRWFDDSLWRIAGGFDYEWGDYSSDQVSVSMNLEKYFNNSPHSLALNAQYFNRDGDFETRDEDDIRAYLIYRYELGENHRPTRLTERVRVERPADPATATEQRVVKHEVTVSDDVFFDLDSDDLRPDGRDTLRRVGEIINKSGVIGHIEVVGHTCDLGSHEYNQGLSERRANQVMEVLVGAGINEDIIECRGEGENHPKHPNTSEANRKLNRRVDIRFLTTREDFERVAVELPPEVLWETREIKQEPAWLRRALRNPALHKRRVDTYQFQTVSSDTEAGGVVFLNRGPSAQDDAESVDQDSSGNVIDVLANDSDPDGDTLTVSAVTQPGNGAVSNNGDNVSYTPLPDFVGTDTFSYTISDPSGDTASATVTVTVVSTNAPPVANDDAVSTDDGISVSINVLANDSDPDGDPLTISSNGSAMNGTVVDNGDGTLTYTPDAGFVGSDSFTYTVSDPDGLSDTASVTIDVTFVNGAPIANDDSASTSKNTDVVIDVLANDTDPDGDPLTVISVVNTNMGTSVINADGTVTYSPMPGWWGGDTFTYTISDPDGETSTATVTLTVTF